MLQSVRKLAFQNLFQSLIIRNLHLSQTDLFYWWQMKKNVAERKAIEESKFSRASAELFEQSEHKFKTLEVQKETESVEFMKKLIFEEAILVYMQQHGKTRRGHVQFIEAALKKMKEYGVHRSLDTYKKILEIFPEVKMIPKTFWQTEFFHYPRQQECALDILVAMEENFIIPDEEFGQLLYKRFGLDTSPMARYQRMMYWMPKLKNTNPWPVPQELPKDASEVARLALTRICPEKETKVSLVEVQFNEFERSWIAHAQSHVQKKLISYLKHSYQSHSTGSNEDSQRILYVDGPQQVWLRNQRLNYYMLTTELDKDRFHNREQFMKNQQDESIGAVTVAFDNWYTSFDPDTQFPVYFGESKPQNMLPANFTKYEDDVDNISILATCMIGNESIAGLRRWVSMLIDDNPDMNQFKIVFRLNSRPGELMI